jgi:hypothetical protein
MICARLGIASRLPAVLQAGADPAYTDENGCTSRWLACEEKHESAAAELMETTKNAGALDLQSSSKYTNARGKFSALHVAIKRGLGSTVAKLLSFGADALLPGKDAVTPVDLPCDEDVKVAVADRCEHVEIT